MTTTGDAGAINCSHTLASADMLVSAIGGREVLLLD